MIGAHDDAEPRREIATAKRVFWRDEKGLAAVEFAMILPVMLFLYLGMVELSRGVRAARQVDIASETVADLIGQNQIASCPTDGSTPLVASNGTPAMICLTYIQGVVTAAAAMLAPMPTSSMSITISEINIQTNPGTAPPYFYATVNWSFSFNNAPPRGGNVANYPACNALAASSLTATNTLTPVNNLVPIQSLAITSSSVAQGSAAGPIILADVTYTYTPIVQLGLGLFGNGAFGKLFTQGGFLMSRTVTGTVRNMYGGGAPLYKHMLFPLTASTLPSGTTITVNGSSYPLSGYNCLSPAQ
jgi:Flp pilus assembly protein TadG